MMEAIDKQSDTSTLFKCFVCGATSVTLEHTYTLIQRASIIAPCTCDKNSGVAIRVQKYKEINLSERSVIDNDHAYEFGPPMPVSESDWMQLSRDVYCQACAEGGTPQSEDFNVDIEKHEYFVRCEGCKREIPFSWSHPDRGGRIWPVEFHDFRPDKGWPEPRYGNKYQRQRKLPFNRKF